MQDLDDFKRTLSDKDYRNVLVVLIEELQFQKSKDIGRLVELQRLKSEVDDRLCRSGLWT
jgi:hypothetical protein